MEDVDLILVDGPPGHLGPMARYPAGPMLAAKCNPECLWVVDDIVRASESDMIHRWTSELGLIPLSQKVWHKKGAALLRSPSTSDDD